jgi:hypothetical protein
MFTVKVTLELCFKQVLKGQVGNNSFSRREVLNVGVLNTSKA